MIFCNFDIISSNCTEEINPKTIRRISFNNKKNYFNLNYLASAGQRGIFRDFETISSRNVRKDQPKNESSELFQPLENLFQFDIFNQPRTGGIQGI